MYNLNILAFTSALMVGLLADSVPASEGINPLLNTAAISRADCLRLMRQLSVPPAEFVPGVDAHGSHVARAEMEDSATPDVLNSLAIVVEPDLASLPGVVPGTEGKARIGVITIDNNGMAYLNGQRLTPNVTGLIGSECKQATDP